MATLYEIIAAQATSEVVGTGDVIDVVQTWIQSKPNNVTFPARIPDAAFGVGNVRSVANISAYAVESIAALQHVAAMGHVQDVNPAGDLLDVLETFVQSTNGLLTSRLAFPLSNFVPPIQVLAAVSLSGEAVITFAGGPDYVPPAPDPGVTGGVSLEGGPITSPPLAEPAAPAPAEPAPTEPAAAGPTPAADTGGIPPGCIALPTITANPSAYPWWPYHRTSCGSFDGVSYWRPSADYVPPPPTPPPPGGGGTGGGIIGGTVGTAWTPPVAAMKAAVANEVLKLDAIAGL